MVLTTTEKCQSSDLIKDPVSSGQWMWPHMRRLRDKENFMERGPTFLRNFSLDLEKCYMIFFVLFQVTSRLPVTPITCAESPPPLLTRLSKKMTFQKRHFEKRHFENDILKNWWLNYCNAIELLTSSSKSNWIIYVRHLAQKSQIKRQLKLSQIRQLEKQ